ncbi:alkyl sulfatase dimerization domain-containing protein [Yinghuangia seranimata]|uniref:alkyl sulfatase dimerization domain-containing protein n=1 Tax=Yinghuangia seranimata TaxID=408067 RepID=UPI00248C8A25|nr:alkyl sulfatase dimerization domain-containing protein [Yinghuangia seranimata]MDI2129275.1 alkyl sulfatase dimerization domain-containing protein [Yinghuangia seranimata]
MSESHSPVGPYLVEPCIHPELAAHTAHFDKRVYTVADHVHVAVGWSSANAIVVEGPEGLVVVDTGSGVDLAATIEAELRPHLKDPAAPVRAVVVTHHHPDHVNGVGHWVSAEDAAAGRVAVYAHRTFLDSLTDQSGPALHIMGLRSVYSLGNLLGPEDTRGGNDAVGPHAGVGQPSFVMPTHLVDDELEVTVAGVRLRMFHNPGETDDAISVHLPDSGVVLCGDTIQGPTLPNIHTLRGCRYRDPMQWVRSIDALRACRADHLVPSHGQPVSGADAVEEVLGVERDCIQYIHDQTVRLMNQGLTPDELAEAVELPAHLAEFKPYAREYYGTVKHTVRQIFFGYLGWFGGDPVDLDPLPRAEAARRTVALMGGRERVLGAAREAYDAGEFQWAAELATHLTRTDRDDTDARQLKAACFRRLGYAHMNINWRNWYLSSANELEEKIQPILPFINFAQIFAPRDLVARIRAAWLVELFTTRLRAEDSGDVDRILGLRVTGGEHYGTEEVALHVRRGVARFLTEIPAEADLVVEITRFALEELHLGTADLRTAFARGGAAAVRGDEAAAAALLDLFDPIKPEKPTELTLR